MSNEEKITARIRKLLKLSKDKGATPAEAQRAAEFAAALMLQHGIEQRELSDSVIMFGAYSKKRYAPWQRVCAQAAGQMVGVRIVRTPTGRISFVGRTNNVEVAEDLTKFFIEQARALLVEEKKVAALRLRGWERPFLNGVALKIGERVLAHIEEMKRKKYQDAGGSTLPALATHLEELENEVEKEMAGKFRTARPRGLRMDTRGFAAGERVPLGNAARVGV